MPITTVRPYFTGYCLHQSLCCEFMLPMQLAILPTSPRKNITGGEFVLADQRSYRERAELFRWCKGRQGQVSSPSGTVKQARAQMRER
jgi:hypothetical protein